MSTPRAISAAIGATPATARAASGVRTSQLVFFGASNIAAGDNAAVASSTPVAAQFCGTATITTGFAAFKPGSVTGLSVNLTVAAAGSSIIVGVYKNGTIINAAAIVTIIATGTQGYITFPSGTYNFAPGDVIDVRIRTSSAWSATTSDAAISVQVEL